jgi:hypothetical protein
MPIPWGEVQLDDSDDGLEIESDVHDEQTGSSDDNDYSTPTTLSTPHTSHLTPRYLRTVNDADALVVSEESEHEYALDDDVKEDTLEIPEEFLLAKPHELDVEDELEGDFKCFLPFLRIHITDPNSLQSLF